MPEPIIAPKPYGIIYCFTNKINGKKYVGQTTRGIEKRVAGHCQSISSKRDIGLFQRALRKYGREGFDVETLDTANDQSELDTLESKYVALFNTICPAGYNLTTGGGAKGKQSEATKRLHSIIAVVQNYAKSIVNPDGTSRFPHPMLNPETRRKVAESKRGKRPSAESNTKRSATMKAKMRGLSDERRAEWLRNLDKARIISANTPKSAETRRKLGLSSQKLKGRKLVGQELISVRERIAKAREIAWEANRGRKQSPEAKAKIAATLRGRKRPPEVGAKVSAKLRGRKQDPEVVARRAASTSRTWAVRTMARVA